MKIKQATPATGAATNHKQNDTTVHWLKNYIGTNQRFDVSSPTEPEALVGDK